MGVDSLLTRNSKTVEDARESGDWTKDTSGKGRPKNEELYPKDWLEESIIDFIEKKCRLPRKKDYQNNPNYPSVNIVTEKFPNYETFKNIVFEIVEKYDFGYKQEDRLNEFSSDEHYVKVEGEWRIGLDQPLKITYKPEGYRLVISPVISQLGWDWEMKLYEYSNSQPIYQTEGGIFTDQFKGLNEYNIRRINRAMRFLNTSFIIDNFNIKEPLEIKLAEFEQLMGVPAVGFEAKINKNNQ